MAKIRNWRVVVASALAFILLIAASASDSWRTGNQMYSDWLFDLGVISLDREPAVLLVEQAGGASDSGTLTDLVVELNRLGATRTVVMPGPLAAAAENLSTDLSDKILVTAAPGTDRAKAEGASWIVPPSFEAGYFRYAPLRLDQSEKNEAGVMVPWFLTLLNEQDSERSPLYLNFGFLKNGLPIVRQQQVLEGEVIAEVVEGRVVLLGPSEDALSPGFPVPGSASPLSPLKMQGLIWATAEGNAGLTVLNSVWTVLFILLLFLLNLFVFQWLSPVFGSLFSLVFLGVIGGAGWFSLQYFHTVLPVVDLSVVQLASLLFVYQARRANEERTVTEMLGTTNAALFERYIPEEFNESASPWPKLVVFISQQLNLERSILLERVPGDHRVREIEAINCNIGDIAEQRRDYERVPYSDALQHRRPLQLKRAYFNSSDTQELEYLTPLIFGGEVLGFWALTVRPGSDWSRETFESNIASFALQIGELLYHRQQLAHEKRRNRRLGRRILALEVGRNSSEQLRSSLELLGNRLGTLETMFDSLNTGAIMYDLFGQVLQANARALDIATQRNLAVYKMTALDFLCELCGLTQDNARRDLRHVTLKRAEIRLPVRAISGQQGLMLAIRPISTVKKDLDAVKATNAPQPFKLLGLSFEITDSSHAGAALERRDDLIQQFFLGLRNQLSRVTLAAHLTSPDLKNVPSGERLLSQVRDFTSFVESTLSKVEQQDVGGQQLQSLESAEPVNVLRTLNNALRRSEPAIKQKRLTVLRDVPIVVPLVDTAADELSDLMDKVLRLLTTDASPGTQLAVSVKEFAGPAPQVSITLSNVGYGLPQVALDRILAKPVVELLNSDDPIEESLGVVKSVSDWGGQAEITAEVGKGFCLQLNFRSMALSDAQTMTGRQEDGDADT
ncbi:MAG: hypothetical protein ABJ375_00405 [Rhizobiaceae bacterium]